MPVLDFSIFQCLKHKIMILNNPFSVWSEHSVCINSMFFLNLLSELFANFHSKFRDFNNDHWSFHLIKWIKLIIEQHKSSRMFNYSLLEQQNHSEDWMIWSLRTSFKSRTSTLNWKTVRIDEDLSTHLNLLKQSQLEETMPHLKCKSIISAFNEEVSTLNITNCNEFTTIPH